MNDDLRQITLLHTLPDEQLTWLSEHCYEIRPEPDTVLFTEVDRADRVFVLLEGELQITKQVGREEMVLDHIHPGAFFGEIPLLTGRPYRVNGRVRGTSRLLVIEAEVFITLLTINRQVMQDVIRTLAQRVRNAEVLVQQRERTIALGTFAAELAHELNNPAAAARRAAHELQDAVQSIQEQTLRLGQHALTTEHHAVLAELQRDTAAASASLVQLDPLAQSEREDELSDWLEAHGVDEGWQLAASLVEAGLDCQRLDVVAAQLPSEALADVLTWLSGTITTSSLLEQARHSTARISELVQTVKQYAYMDQAPLQEVDVHDGLDNTLRVLGHKMRGTVTLSREYDQSVPRITAYASELNQVWTNLIDNALDAAGATGHVWVRTTHDGRHVVVEIADNGSGIPLELQTRIFQPFFTTKGAKGTGLGLDITHRIVVQRHNGELTVQSKPGDTRFQVRLPVARS